jgi:hypothetical protein
LIHSHNLQPQGGQTLLHAGQSALYALLLSGPNLRGELSLLPAVACQNNKLVSEVPQTLVRQELMCPGSACRPSHDNLSSTARRVWAAGASFQPLWLETPPLGGHPAPIFSQAAFTSPSYPD